MTIALIQTQPQLQVRTDNTRSSCETSRLQVCDKRRLVSGKRRLPVVNDRRTYALPPRTTTNLTIIDFMKSIGEPVSSLKMGDLEIYGNRQLLRLCAEWSRTAQQEETLLKTSSKSSNSSRSLIMTMNIPCTKIEVEAITKLAELKPSSKRSYDTSLSEDDVLEFEEEMECIENSLSSLEQELKNAPNII